MVETGLDIISGRIPKEIAAKNIALLCHAPSINSDFEHCIDLFSSDKNFKLAAILGPQHGLFGQTQDNMIEWEGYKHPKYDIPVYSLYGENRKPTKEILKDIEAFVIDLQDVGCRPYTYIWSMKLCMEACSEANIPIWVLDRPNPVSRMGFEGPILKRDFYTFVGGAEIPLLHGMTIGEIALWLKEFENIDCDLNVVWMKGWKRNMMYDQTGLPWVAPSPNMPALSTAIVYPGMVLVEALNLSEARGTTTPFELFGAPQLDTDKLIKNLRGRSLNGCNFRSHDFIPTFNKYKGEYCKGIQIHITDIDSFEPVYTALNIFDAIQDTTSGYLSFNPPPYEYEYRLMPYDILIGDSNSRNIIENGGDIKPERERWKDELSDFNVKFKQISYYS